MRLLEIPRDVFSWLLDGVTGLSDEFKELSSSMKELHLKLETDSTVSGKDLSVLIQSGIQIISRDMLSPEKTERVHKFFGQLLNTEYCPGLSKTIIRLYNIPDRGFNLVSNLFDALKKTNYVSGEFVNVVQTIEKLPISEYDYLLCINSLICRISEMSHDERSKKEMREVFLTVSHMLLASIECSDVITETDRYFLNIINHKNLKIVSEVFEILHRYNLKSRANFCALITLDEPHLVQVRDQLNQWTSQKKYLTQVALDAIVLRIRIPNISLYRENIKSEYREYITNKMLLKNTIPEQINTTASEGFLRLLNILEHGISQYDSVLISIGAFGGYYEQYFPRYMVNKAKSEKVLICLIDPGFLDEQGHFKNQLKDSLMSLLLTPERVEVPWRWRYRDSQEELDLTLEIFPCEIPNSKDENMGLYFYNLFKESLTRALNHGIQIYIANHTQVYSLRDILLVAEVYNKIKSTHGSPQLLQLYTHGGKSNCSGITYYDNLCYDKFSEPEFRDRRSLDSLGVVVPHRHFYLYEFKDLENLDAFRPRLIRSCSDGTDARKIQVQEMLIESVPMIHSRSLMERETLLTRQAFIEMARTLISEITKTTLPNDLQKRANALIEILNTEVSIVELEDGSEPYRPSAKMQHHRLDIEATLRESSESSSEKSALRILLERIIAFFKKIFGLEPEPTKQDLVERVSQFFSRIPEHARSSCRQDMEGEAQQNSNPDLCVSPILGI